MGDVVSECRVANDDTVRLLGYELELSHVPERSGVI